MSGSIDDSKHDATISYYGRRQDKPVTESPLSNATTVQIRAKHLRQLKSHDDNASDGAEDSGGNGGPAQRNLQLMN